MPTLVVLKALAKKNKVKGYSALNKDKFIKLLVKNKVTIPEDEKKEQKQVIKSSGGRSKAVSKRQGNVYTYVNVKCADGGGGGGYREPRYERPRSESKPTSSSSSSSSSSSVPAKKFAPVETKPKANTAKPFAGYHDAKQPIKKGKPLNLGDFKGKLEGLFDPSKRRKPPE